MKSKIICLMSLCCIFQLTTFVWAQEKSNNSKTIIVGIKEAPPFTIKNSDGSWEGISIDLWHKIAQRHNLSYEIKEFNLKDLLKAVETDTIDVAVAALTITPDREKYLDFTHAFYVEGLGIAVPKSNDRNWILAVKRFFSIEFLSVISLLALVLLIFGYLGWFFEHKNNKDQFNPGFLKGLGDGFWWSAVTMTTVGYGDKSPKSFAGRLIALVWMFTSIIIISSFTAAITSAITVSQLEDSVNGPKDLYTVRVGSVHNSAAAQILKDRGIEYIHCQSLEQALLEIQNNKVDAVVYDAPLLKYNIKNKFSNDIKVLSNTFVDQPYGLALPTNHPLKEMVNLSLLEIINTADWQDVVSKYLGN